MKLRLPNKLIAAIVAAATPVLFSTLSTATLGAAAVVTLGHRATADTVWDTNWGIADMPTIGQGNVISQVPLESNGTWYLQSSNAYQVDNFGAVAEFNGTKSGVTANIFGGKYADNSTSSWMKVTGGQYGIVGGALHNYWQSGGGSHYDFTGDTHILVDNGEGSTLNIKDVVGGIHQDAYAVPVFTGNTYVSIVTNSVTGGVIGGNTVAHTKGTTLNGGTNIFIYSALTGSSTDVVASVIGGNAMYTNSGSTMTMTGVSHVTLDLGAVTSSATFEKKIIGGSYVSNANASTAQGGSSIRITNAEHVTFNQILFGGHYKATGAGTLTIGNINMAIDSGTFTNAIIGGTYVDGTGGASIGDSAVGDVNISLSGGTYRGEIYGGSHLRRNSNSLSMTQGNISIALSGSAVIQNNIYAAGYQEGNSKMTTASAKVSIGSGVAFTKDGGLTISALYKHGSTNTSTVTGSKTLAFTDGTTYTNLSDVTFDGFDTVEVTEENGSVTLGSLNNTTKLTKNGAGALTITNVSNLSGGLVVNGGYLTLSGGSEQAMSGDVTVNSGAELALGRNDFFQYNGHTLTVDGGTVAFGTTRQSFNSGYSVILKNGATMIGRGGNYNGEYNAALDYYAGAASTLKSTTGNNVIESNIAARDGNGTVVLAVDDESSATTSSLTLKGSMVGSGTFKKTGADKLILDGGDGGVTHNTRFVMESGSLQVDNAVTFSNTVTLAAGTSLSINGTLSANTLSLVETLTLGGSGTLALGNGGLTVGAASGNFTAVGDLHYSDGDNGFLTGGGTVTLISHGNTNVTGLGDSSTVTFTDGIQANLSKTDAGDIVASWEGSAQDDSPYYVNTAVALNDVDDTATVIALNGGTLTVDRELKETESLLLANPGSVLNIAEGIDVSAGKVTITDRSGSLHLTGQGYVVIDAGEAASHATEILGTATGDGNMKIAADATLAKDTPTHLTGTLQIGTGAEAQTTLSLGDGWGAGGRHDSESFDLSSFSSIVLDNGRIAYNGASSTLNSLTVTENGGKLSMWDSNVSGTTQLANTTTLNGDLTLEVGWKAKMNIAHLTGAGDLTVNTGLADATADDVTTLSIGSLQGYTGTLSISKNNGTLEPVAITTGGAVNMKGMSLTNATVNMVTTGNITMNSELVLNNSSLLIRADGDVRTHTFASMKVAGTGIVNIQESGSSGKGWNSVINVTSLTNEGNSAATLKLGNAARAYTSLYNINGGSFNGEIILNGTAVNGTRRTGLQINAAGVTDNSVITFDSSSAGNNNLGLGINADISVKGIQHATNSSVAATIYSGAITNTKSGDAFASQGTTYHTVTMTGDGNYATSAAVKNYLNLTMSGSGTQTFNGDVSSFNGQLTATNGILKIADATPTDANVSTLNASGLHADGGIIASEGGAVVKIGNMTGGGQLTIGGNGGFSVAGNGKLEISNWWSFNMTALRENGTATMKATGGVANYGFNREDITITDAKVSYTAANGDPTVANKFTNSTIVAVGSGSSLTVTNAANTLVGVDAEGGAILVQNAANSAATLKSIKAVGGDVTIQSLGIGATVNLTELTIAGSKTVSAYTGTPTAEQIAAAQNGSNNAVEATLAISNGTLSAGSGAKLNAHLSLGNNTTLNIADATVGGAGLTMGSNVTFEQGGKMNLSDDIINGLNGLITSQAFKSGLTLFSGVDSFNINGAAYDADATYKASDYFNLNNGNVAVTRPWDFVVKFGDGTAQNAQTIFLWMETPEPATATLSLLALAALAARRRRK